MKKYKAPKKIQSAEGVFQKVLEIAGRGNSNQIAVDSPCGTGVLSDGLMKLGYTVKGIDIVEYEESVLKDNLIIHDLNKKLPFESESVDLFVSVEGIEHLESPTFFIREINRVLKKGGRLILSTPNTYSIKSRYRYLMKGNHIHFDYGNEDVFRSGHIHFIDMVYLHHTLRKNGFAIKELHTNKYNNKMKYRLIAKFNRRRLKSNQYHDILASDEALFGECLIIEAEK